MSLPPVKTINPVPGSPPGAATTRITVNLPTTLVERLRNTVYGLPHATLAGLVETAIHSTLTQLEAGHGGPFGKRARELKPGRPKRRPSDQQRKAVLASFVAAHTGSGDTTGIQPPEQRPSSLAGASVPRNGSESSR